MVVACHSRFRMSARTQTTRLKGDFPLTIAPSAFGNLSVTAPAPKPNAKLGMMSSGTLSFATNEPDSPTHRITLNTTLFGGSLEFLDDNGQPLKTPSLTLGAASAADCPDSATYRVHNTGNLAFQLTGQVFPRTSAARARARPGCIWNRTATLSSKSAACHCPETPAAAAARSRSRSDTGYCGTPPSLNVTWPAGVALQLRL